MLSASSIQIKNSNSFTSLLDIFYPIGGIYLTTSATTPAQNLGGTWVEIKDAFLTAAGDSYTAKVGINGGAYSINTSQLPEHNHTMAHTHALNGSKAAANSSGTHRHYIWVSDKTDGRGFVAGFAAESMDDYNAVSGSRSYTTVSSSANKNNLVSSITYNAKIHGAKTNTVANAGAHTHTLTGNTAASSAANTGNIGGGQNFAPYHYSVRVWQRTA